jgi:7,8-dihydropterin-6-yl-methyl-4-(beta-D-ribofuranosyl)aminobenzene 5'-phosphate synthase
VNSVRRVQKLSGVEKVHAIVGGFHLAPARDEIVARTVCAFGTIDPDDPPGPLHRNQHADRPSPRAAPAKLLMPSTGTRVIFGV